MLQDSTNSWKAFSASCWLQKHFPCKKLSRCLKKTSVQKGSRLASGSQVNMADKANLHSPIRSTLKRWFYDAQLGAVVETGPVLLPNAGCRRCSFQCVSLICWAYFSDVMVLQGLRKLQWIRQAADPQTVTLTFFWCKFGFRKCYGASRFIH